MSYTLYTEATPNPLKVHIALHEVGAEYTSKRVDFGKEEQKSSEFRKLNPNARIPVLVDHGKGDHVVIESGAILLHLAEDYEELLPKDSSLRSEAVQWLMWQMSGLGPMFGQLMVFAAAFDNSVPRATERYSKEAERLLTVLDTKLEGRDYIAKEHSIADIACAPWVRTYQHYIGPVDAWPNVAAWLARCFQRPAYQRAADVDEPLEQETRMSNFRKATVGLGG